MKKSLPVWMLSIFIFVIAVSGCKKSEKVHANIATILSGSDPGINTCGWIIRIGENAGATSPQNSFKPVTLNPQYQTDGMRVKITYTIPDMPPIQCGSNSEGMPGYTQIAILNVQQEN